MINEWKGAAESQAEQWTVTVLEAVPNALYRIDAGNGIAAQYRAQEGDTTAMIAAALADLLDAFSTLTVTRDAAVISLSGEPGIPIGTGRGPLQVATPASHITRLRTGVPAVPQRTDLTFPATTEGGTFTITCDFGSGNETTDPITFPPTPANVIAKLEALTTPGSGDIACAIVSTDPYTIRLTFQGSLAGTDVTVNASGAALTGNAAVDIVTTQTIGANAHELQAVWVSNMNTESSETRLRFSADGGSTFTSWTAHDFASMSDGIQERLDELYGEGIVSFSRHIYTDESFGLLLITFNDTEPRDTIVVEASDLVYGAGYPVVSSETLQTGGGSTANEFQVVTAAGSGNYTLTFDAEATDDISTSATNAQILSALEANDNIGSGNVTIHRPSHYTIGNRCLYLVEFQSSLGGEDQPLMTFTGTSGTADGSVETGLDGQAPINEVHRLKITAEGGTFKLTQSGNETAAIDHDATAAELTTAYEALASIGSGNVDINGSGTAADPFFIEYIESLAQTDVAAPTADVSTLTGGKPIAVAENQSAAEGTNEQQLLVIDPHADGGTYRLGSLGEYTGNIAYNAAYGTVDTALETVLGAGNVSVSGSPDSFVIEFTGDTAATPMELLTIDQDGLSVSASTSLEIQVDRFAAGPHSWNVPENWTLGHVPETGETVVIGSGDVPIRYGLVQSANFTAAAGTLLTVAAADFVDGQKVRLKTTDTFPALDTGSLSTETDYWIVSIGIDDEGQLQVQISDEDNGSPLTFTDGGTGTHTLEVQLEALRVYNRYTGEIGLDRQNADGVWEEAQRFLRIGLLAADEVNVETGIGDGSGSSLLNLDFATSPLKARVLPGGSGTGDLPALQMLCDGLSTCEIDVIGGELGLALESDQTAALKWLRAYSGRAVLGNVTITNIRDYGHIVEFAAATYGASGIDLSTASG